MGALAHSMGWGGDVGSCAAAVCLVDAVGGVVGAAAAAAADVSVAAVAGAATGVTVAAAAAAVVCVAAAAAAATFESISRMLSVIVQPPCEPNTWSSRVALSQTLVP